MSQDQSQQDQSQQDQLRQEGGAAETWLTKAMHVTEQTMRGGRLDKPIAELSGLGRNARRKVAGLMPQAAPDAAEVTPEEPEPLTPVQLAERARRLRQEKLMIAGALAVLLLTVWLRRKTDGDATG